MQKRFRGIPRFDGRFQSASSDPSSSTADGGLPTAPPDLSANPNTGGAPASPTPSGGTQPPAPASGSVNLSKLYQNLESSNITSASALPDNMMTLAEALRKHFGDQAEIDVDGLTIKVKTQKGVRELEVGTQRFRGGDTRAILLLRVDKHTVRPIGNLVRYGNEYYINADLLEKIDNTSKPAQKKDDSQKPTGDKKPKRRLPKSVLYGAGLLAAGGAAVGLSRFLGGGDDDDDKKKAQSDSGGIREEVVLNSAGGGESPIRGGPAPAGGGESSIGGGPAPAGGGESSIRGGPAPAGGGSTAPNIVVSVPAPQVIREITSGEAPVQTRRKDNETVVKAGTSDGVFTLNIGADKTLILKDKEVVGEFPTSEIIRAVGQMADGKTEKEIRRSGEFDDLLKNPWFLVAIALALVAFTRRGGRE
jgi:hypothetical protein